MNCVQVVVVDSVEAVAVVTVVVVVADLVVVAAAALAEAEAAEGPTLMGNWLGVFLLTF